MASLSEMRAAMTSNNARQKGVTSKTRGDAAMFPFWDAPEGSSTTLRFLPDADPAQTLPWVERRMLSIPFCGIINSEYPTTKTVKVTIPSLTMFRMKCPINEAIKPWWKDEGKRDLAKVYYFKKSYLTQALVVNSPFTEEQPPENPIRRVVVNAQIFSVLENSLMDPEMEDNPFDLDLGRDFIIRKTRQGEYANYSTSNWSLKQRSLSPAERDAITKWGLFKLADFVGAAPSEDAIALYEPLMQDSLAGLPFDAERFGAHFRAFGNDQGSAASSSPAPVQAKAAEAKPVEIKADETAETKTAEPRTSDEILANIRRRTLAKGAVA